MEVIITIIGLVSGGGVIWLILRPHLAVLKERVKTLSNQNDKLEVELKEKQDKVSELADSLAVETTNRQNLQINTEEQKKEREVLRKNFMTEFENLSNRVFDAKNKEFATQSKNSLSDLLKPMKERIIEFEGKINNVHKDTITNNAGLRNELKNMKDLNLKMSEDAQNLTRALKADTKLQGGWGEVILERVLEMSGLEKDREYFKQKGITLENGTHVIPDVVVHLPDQKKIIIDSKVSIKDYTLYINTVEEEKKTAYLKAHINSIKKHVNNLAEKNYQSLFDTSSPDFVLMFIPIEPAFSVAVNADDALYNRAFAKKVIIVTPATLLAVIRIISTMWRNSKQQSNAIEIARQAGTLHDKFVGFTNDLLGLGKHLVSSKQCYETAMNKLSEGKGNLVSKVDVLKKLGVKAEKNIDPALLERSKDDNSLLEP